MPVAETAGGIIKRGGKGKSAAGGNKRYHLKIDADGEFVRGKGRGGGHGGGGRGRGGRGRGGGGWERDDGGNEKGGSCSGDREHGSRSNPNRPPPGLKGREIGEL